MQRLIPVPDVIVSNITFLWFLLFLFCYSQHVAVNMRSESSFLHLKNKTIVGGSGSCSSQAVTSSTGVCLCVCCRSVRCGAGQPAVPSSQVVAANRGDQLFTGRQPRLRCSAGARCQSMCRSTGHSSAVSVLQQNSRRFSTSRSSINSQKNTTRSQHSQECKNIQDFSDAVDWVL